MCKILALVFDPGLVLNRAGDINHSGYLFQASQVLIVPASSHIARRTFVGNLYKKVKDPNLVGDLSGHKDGSKAFARYRDIDEGIKRELVSLIDWCNLVA